MHVLNEVVFNDATTWNSEMKACSMFAAASSDLRLHLVRVPIGCYLLLFVGAICSFTVKEQSVAM